jgi:hypothetical protein
LDSDLTESKRQIFNVLGMERKMSQLVTIRT